MYKKLSPKPDYAAMSAEILEFWKERGIKRKVIDLNKDTGKIFSFYEGPPTANGNPHAGHVLTRALKDIYTRAAAMRGFYVPRKGGWDTHGLPVEISVEKSLHISGKQDIERYGVENFIKACKTNVWKCIERWKEFSEKVGYSLDLDDDCYNPYENYYIESVWWSIKELDKKGYLYKGHKILPSCPSCQTALSSNEVAQAYKDRKDLTVTAKFYCENLKASFLAWTTTPWTLPSNVALCVSATIDYSFVKSENETFILANDLIEANFKGKEYTVVKTVKGAELVGEKYAPLFDYAPRATGYRIVSDNYVTTTDGTGIVHIAPAYGEDDNRVGKVWDLPFLQAVNSAGVFNGWCKEYAGKFVFDTNENVNLTVVKDLGERDLVFSKAWHTHSYPHCWRCGTPLIYFARDSWFVKTTAYKDKLIEANDNVNWFPESFKKGRMGNFLENNIDWCLSRDRYWGTPLPVWQCDCGHHETIGSIAELVEKSGCAPDIELHKPYIDAVTIKCPVCGKQMKRESEVIDVWYDSGAMPFAQFHYPFENKEEFEKRFPADFIMEGYDQTRGWFYTLEAINTALFGRAPMKNCLANGMICDEKGEKMSKSKGNFTDPMDVINKFGGDSVRFMFYSNGQPYYDVIFSEKSILEASRKYIDVFYNSFVFYVLYADINNFAGGKKTVKDVKLSVMDKYILSELNTLIENVTRETSEYMATEASRRFIDFADVLSNWYIRRSRKRFYDFAEGTDSEAAFVTLYTVLDALAELSAPFIPFLSESIYQTIVVPFNPKAPESVHLCQYPKVEKNLINAALQADMNEIYTFCEIARNARQKAGIKIRQPLKTMYIGNTARDIKYPKEYLSIIADELNVKEVLIGKDLSGYVNYAIKPNLKTLGPKYGSKLNAIRTYLTTADTRLIKQAVANGGVFTTAIDGAEIKLEEADLLITATEKEGFVSDTKENFTVVLDAHLTDDLIKEGYLREFISHIQSLRKSSGFDVTDRIKLNIWGDTEISKALSLETDYIKKELLAVEVKFTEATAAENSDEIDFDGKILFASIVKAKK
ncbi:MAG: isoleucine--tRNA ligase [Christensenellaceae bacterium]|jgi:isoleucyl-tRNA synthetase|nr:isoleucine--tRNA ligase [Christensenellaceae bacterium]